MFPRIYGPKIIGEIKNKRIKATNQSHVDRLEGKFGLSDFQFIHII